MFKKISIGLVAFHSEKYLIPALESLTKQDYPDFEILIRDHDPKMSSYQFLLENRPDLLSQVHFFKVEEEGLNHSQGHNFLIRQALGDYYLCASNDMYYEPDLLSKMVKTLETENLDWVIPKLKYWDFDFFQKGDLELSKTDRLDSCGLRMYQNQHCIDLGQGEIDHGQYDKTKPWGGSGALFMIQISALTEIAYFNRKKQYFEYFDENLHYFNDVDLMYRLNWAAKKGGLASLAIAYHDRLVKTEGKGNIWQKMWFSRNTKSLWARKNAYLGKLVLVFKNFSLSYSAKVIFKTWLYYKLVTVFLFLKETKVLSVYGVFSKIYSGTCDKRRNIKRILSPREMEKKFY
ncbi:MAG TPA: glycosyltransferase [Candidatus Gracilibacteria bacterium]|nr:glycosyltransferase [Candidatus Gracilibacteria bacterium]